MMLLMLEILASIYLGHSTIAPASAAMSASSQRSHTARRARAGVLDGWTV